MFISQYAENIRGKRRLHTCNRREESIHLLCSVSCGNHSTLLRAVREAEANSLNLINRRVAKEPSSSWKVRGSTENFPQNAFLLIAYFRVTHITEAISQQGHCLGKQHSKAFLTQLAICHPSAKQFPE